METGARTHWFGHSGAVCGGEARNYGCWCWCGCRCAHAIGDVTLRGPKCQNDAVVVGRGRGRGRGQQPEPDCIKTVTTHSKKDPSDGWPDFFSVGDVDDESVVEKLAPFTVDGRLELTVTINRRE